MNSQDRSPAQMIIPIVAAAVTVIILLALPDGDVNVVGLELPLILVVLIVYFLGIVGGWFMANRPRPSADDATAG